MAAPATAQAADMTLQPARLPGMCITMNGPANEAVSMPCTGGVAEKFELPDAGGGPIRQDGECLVPRGEGNYPALVAAECDGTPEQTWTLNDKGELRSAAGRCVSLLGASSRNGELVYAAECPKDYDAQGWIARRVDFTNVTDASLESLARPGQCIGYDTQLSLYPCTDAYRQVMSFDPKELGQIRMMSSCLSGGFVFGALRLGECWDVPDQKWTVISDGRVVSQKLQCIEVSNEEGRDVLRTKECTTAVEQKWRVRVPPPGTVPVAPTEAPVEAPTIPAAPDPIVAPVAAAVITLRHEQLPGMCLSLSGRNGESESQPCDGSAKQSFKLPGVTPGPIFNGDLCLAARGQGAYPQLVAGACDGSPDQTWTMAATGEVRNAAGRCLSLLGVSSRNGERIYAGECPTGLPAHHWHAVAIDPAQLHPGDAMLESTARPGKCLGTDGALGLVDCAAKLGRVFSLDLGAPTQLRMMGSCLAGSYVQDALSLGQCWDLPQQKWSLNSASNLVNAQGKCIAVVNEGGKDVLRTVACLPVPEHQWTVKTVKP